MDMAMAQNTRVRLRTPQKKVAWMIPGATFGNLNEEEFLGSLVPLARPGDLLVIGTDTLPEGGLSNAEKRDLEKQYKDQKVRTLLEVHMLSAWKQHHQAWPENEFKAVLDSYDALAVDGYAKKHSKIKDSLSIEMFLTIEDSKKLLATSTRYREDRLVEYVSKWGFSYVTSIPSTTKDSHFKQIVLRFDGNKS